MWEEVNLRGVEGGKIIFRIHYMEKNLFSIRGKESSEPEESGWIHPSRNLLLTTVNTGNSATVCLLCPPA